MNITLVPQNADDMFKLLGFLKDYSIPFQIPTDSLAAILDTLKHHNLESFKDILTGTALEELCVPKSYEQKLLLPTSDLKHFCGSEWIICGKYVSEDILYKRIQQYAEINQLKKGMYLQLDETLRKVLLTDKLVVNDYELRELFKGITS